MSRSITLQPQHGPQSDFHASPADITIFGGGAGGGKTWSLLVEPLRHITTPDFRAGIFRRTRPQITMDGGMWDEAESLYAPLKPKINRGKLTMDFRWNSRISFNGLLHDASVRRYDGAQFAFIGFDQLEEFTANQFWYMGTRVRSRTGIRPYIRATCNPEPDSWLSQLLQWWIGPDGYIIKPRCGKVRHFIRDGEDIIWSDNPATLNASHPEKITRSLTFILATVYDNKQLLDIDPEYIGRLQMQHPLVYLRLHGEGVGEENKGGNWAIRAGAGTLFNAEWFTTTSKIPDYQHSIDVVYWDTAATEKDADTKTEKPSATAYVWLKKANDRYIIMDMGEFYEFTTVEDTILRETKRIAETINNNVHIRWEREPGSASKRESVRWRKLFSPFTLSARDIVSRKDKVRRALPVANAAHKGKVQFKQADWNMYLANYLHNMPAEPNDLMDALSGAYNAADSLTVPTRSRYPDFYEQSAPQRQRKHKTIKRRTRTK